MMVDYVLSPQTMRHTSGSSAGNQPKYFENNTWYKVNHLGYEGLVEELASKILQHSNVMPIEFAEYEQCTINGKKGCKSKHFLTKDESLISFERLHTMYRNRGLQDALMEFRAVEERIEYTIDFIKAVTGLDCSGYLSVMLTLDMLLLNQDRHCNNMAVIANEQTNTYRLAPVFDNGAGLLSSFMHYPLDVELEENIYSVVGLPFSSNLYTQAKAAGFGFTLNYEEIYKLLDEYPNGRAKEVLLYQMEKYKHLLQNKEKEIEIEIEEQEKE